MSVSKHSQHSESALISTYPTLGCAHLKRLWIKTNDSETAVCAVDLLTAVLHLQGYCTERLKK